MQSDLVDKARALGVSLGSVHAGQVIGWTTDPGKANGCRDAGLRVTSYTDSLGVQGWEIVAPADAIAPTKGKEA